MSFKKTRRVVGLVHAIFPAIEPMRDVLARMLPEVGVINHWDEGLITEFERLGGPVGDALERLADIIDLHVRAGVDAVMTTCTAYSNAVPEMRRRFPELPILAVDQIMVDHAVATASRIGVIASSAAGLGQQETMLRTAARDANKQIEIATSLQTEAMAALQHGDREAHDRIILAAIPKLMESVEVVLLAQVSMSPVAAKLPANLPKPVLSSPQLAANRLREILLGIPAGVP